MSDDPNRGLKSIEDLGNRLQERREKAGLTPKPPRPAATGEAGRALHASVDFVVSTLIGALLGFGIGNWLGAKEIGLVLGLAVGFAAGFRGLLRRSQLTEDQTEKEQDGDGRNAD